MTNLADSYAIPRIFNPFLDPSYGASDDALNLGKQFLKIVGSFTEGSATGNMRFAEAFQSLREIAKDCTIEDWDGEGAQPISPEAIAEANRMLLALPLQIPMPEIFPEGTGSIAFEWYRAKGYRFAIAISGNDVIEYAGLLGPGNTVYGACRAPGWLPKLIRDHLNFLYA